MMTWRHQVTRASAAMVLTNFSWNIPVSAPAGLNGLDSLGPTDAICRQRSVSTLAQVMACCLTAPSHYLNQCWLIISNVKWHSSKGKFTRDQPSIIEIVCKIKYLKFHSNFPGANELKTLFICLMFLFTAHCDCDCYDFIYQYIHAVVCTMQ